MKMKKLLSLLLVAIMVIGLVACSGNGDTEQQTDAPAPDTEATDAPTDNNSDSGEPIPHTEVEIKWPAIIDVNEDVFANKQF